MRSGNSLAMAPSLPKSAAMTRTWPALLTLYFLAPLLGEVLSWSTLPLAFIFEPAKLIFEPALYGSGAILIRELVRRRGLHWGNVLILGAAYGVLEEGVDIQTWFNPAGLHGLGVYGRYWETNWVWAAGLTVFHMVFSITIPIILAESCFPQIAALPWLGHKGRNWLTAWLTLAVVIGVLGYGWVLGKQTGYLHPPFPQYLVAVGLMLALLALGVRLRLPPPTQTARPAPRLWTVRLAALGMSTLFFLVFYGVPSLIPLPPVELVLLAFIIVLAVTRVRTWATRASWDNAQRLALASGALGFWLAVSPIFWFTGLPLVALLLLVLLIWLARRAAYPSLLRAERATSQ